MSGNIGQNPLVLYNWNPATQLSHYLAAQAAVAAGVAGATAKIVALGDSTTVGVGDDLTSPNFRNGPSYPNDLAQDLAAAGVPAQSDNFLGGLAGEDGRITLLGDAYWSTVPVPGARALATQSAGSGLEFKLSAPGVYDTLSVDYLDVGTGSLAISADHGPVTNLQLGNTGQTLTRTISLPLASHSEVAIQSTTSTPVYVEGAAFTNSVSASVQVYNAGTQGAESYIVNTDATINGQLYSAIGQVPGILELSPNLVLIDYGINDVINGTATPPQTAANIAGLVTQFQAAGIDSVIVIPEPFESVHYATYIPALRTDLQAVATAMNVPIIDLSATFGDDVSALAAAGLMADNLHPDAALYADIAADIAKLLTGGVTMSGTTLNVPDGSGLAVAGSGNTITAGYQSLVNVVGDANTIRAHARDTVNVVGANNVITSTEGLSVNLTGDGNTVAAGASAIGVQYGTGVVLDVSGSTLALGDGVGVLLAGSANTAAAGYDCLVGVVGNGSAIAARAGDTVNVVGDQNAITSADGLGVNLTGNGNTVTAGASQVAVHYGIGTSLNLSDSTLALGDGVGVLLAGSGNAVAAGWQTLVNLVGDGNTVTGNGRDTFNVVGQDNAVTSAEGIVVNLTGDGNTVTAGASTVNVWHGTGTAINVSGGTLALGDGVGLRLTGSGNAVTAGWETLVNLVGDSNAVSAQGRDTVNVVGQGNAVTAASGIAVNLTGNGNAVTADASAVNVVYGAGVTVSGSNTSISAGFDTSIAVSGSGNTVYGHSSQDQAASMAAIDSVSVNGASNMVFLSTDRLHVSDNSSGLTLIVSGAQGPAHNTIDMISTFGAARGAVLDLIGGAGGYATASAALQALASDGHGGSLLALGAGAGLDFAGLGPTQLSVANFHVG